MTFVLLYHPIHNFYTFQVCSSGAVVKGLHTYKAALYTCKWVKGSHVYVVMFVVGAIKWVKGSYIHMHIEDA